MTEWSRVAFSRSRSRKHEEGFSLFPWRERSYIAITLHNEVGLALLSLLLGYSGRVGEKSSNTNPPSKELFQLKRGLIQPLRPRPRTYLLTYSLTALEGRKESATEALHE